MMPSIAIVGPDGAGKTTITQRIVASSFLPIRYIYMGINLQACNFALPTTRWAGRMKQWLDRKNPRPRREGAAPGPSNKSLPSTNGPFRMVARLVNRLADEWYRQFLSWYFRWRGYIVLYDRHFVFDFSEDPAAGTREPLDGIVHRWFLKHFYPRPNLVIFLDAPSEILYERKREWSVDDLERKRRSFMRLGNQVPNLERVDATQPIEIVYAQTLKIIEEYCALNGQRGHTSPTWNT